MKPPLTLQLPVPLPSYPHMMDAETIIWTAFLSANPYPSAHVAYDVHVGTEPTLPPDTEPNIAKMAAALFTKRIDACLFLPSATLCIEVKPNASSYAIGQALCYALLFSRDFPTYPQPVPMIVTDIPHPDTPYLCDQLHIALIETGPLTA